jgi:hypothetical protein
MQRLLLLYTALVLCTAVQAQEAEPHHYFGIRAGMGFSHPNFAKGSPPSDFQTSWGAGLIGGFFLNVPISQKLSIQPEYVFRQIHSEVTEPMSELNFSYLSLPVLFKFRTFQNLSIVAGPQFDLLIKAQRGGTDTTHETETRSISTAIGLEYTVWKSLAINLRYFHGFNHISTEPVPDASYEFKFEGVEVSASFGF